MLYSDVALCSTDTAALRVTETMRQNTNNGVNLREGLKREKQRSLIMVKIHVNSCLSYSKI